MSPAPLPATSARAVPRRVVASAALLATTALALASTPAPAASRAKAAQALAYFDRGAKLYRRGKYAESAPMFLRAWSTHSVPDYLFNAARAEHRSGQITTAREHYQVCLGLPRLNPTIRKRARAHIDEIEAQLAAKKPPPPAKPQTKKLPVAPPAAPAKPVGPTTASPAVQQTDAAAGSWMRPVGWVALGGGLLAGGLGAWLLISHGDDQAALDKQLTQQNGDGLITGIDHLSYSDEQTRLHQDRRLAVGSLVAAGALAAVGGWMLWRAPDTATAVVLGDGLGVALQTRF